MLQELQQWKLPTLFDMLSWKTARLLHNTTFPNKGKKNPAISLSNSTVFIIVSRTVNYCIRTIEINIDKKRHNNSGDYCVQSQNNSVWFSKIMTLNSFWTRTKKLLLQQVVRKAYDKQKCFYFELLESSAYFPMQININVYVLTRVETITSKPILFSNFNDC